MKDNHLCMDFIYSTTREKCHRYKLRENVNFEFAGLGWRGVGVLSGAHAPDVV